PNRSLESCATNLATMNGPPSSRCCRTSRGVRRVSDRRVLKGFFQVLRSGPPWQDVSESYGPYTTCQLPLTCSAMRRPSIACLTGKSVAGLSSPAGKNIPLRDLPKSTLELPPSRPL